MNNVGSITVSTAIGAGIGGATAFVTAGPAAVVPGMKVGAAMGAQFGGIAKVEQGVDAAGRKVEQIVVDAGIRVNAGVDKVANTVDEATRDFGVKVAQMAATASDKWTDAGIKWVDKCVTGIAGLGKEWTGAGFGLYVISSMGYILNNSTADYNKNCGNGVSTNFACAVVAGNILVESATMGIIGLYICVKVKRTLLG